MGAKNEPSQWDGSFEHPKQMFRFLGKLLFTFLRDEIGLSGSMNCNTYRLMREG